MFGCLPWLILHSFDRLSVLAKNEVDDVVETVSTDRDARVGHRNVLVEIFLRHSQVFIDTIVECGRDLEGLDSHSIEV